jgi:mycobactin peptide synthetase MbtE
LDDTLACVPDGVVGELYIGGDQLSRGYLGEPGLTAAHFIAHPFNEGQRLYRSGDMAIRHADGAIELLGRRDHQVKISGFRVNISAIESAITEHPDVETCAVVIRGDEAPWLDAYIVVCRDTPPARGMAHVRSFVSQRLPAPMIPRRWTTVAELPRLSNGKVDRLALGASHPLSHSDVAADSFHGRPTIESVITEIWKSVLHIESIGPDDSFLDVGGDSLSAMRIVSRVATRYHVDFSIDDLLAQPTLRAFSAAVATRLIEEPS